MSKETDGPKVVVVEPRPDLCPECGGLGLVQMILPDGEPWTEPDGAPNLKRCPACEGAGFVPREEA